MNVEDDKIKMTHLTSEEIKKRTLRSWSYVGAGLIIVVFLWPFISNTLNGTANKLETTSARINTIASDMENKVQPQAKSTDVPKTDNKPTATSNPLPTSRSKPASIGTTIDFTNSSIIENYNGQLSVDEAIRGDKAWRLIEKENKFNEEAPEGKEYLLAKLSIKISGNKNPDAKVSISKSDFTLVSSQGKDYKFFSVVAPEPTIKSELYVNAQHTGYVAFLVDKNDSEPLITFARKSDGTGGVWFKTK
ncbi:hypothetical protein WMW72_12005 [Paenibacillus filicis]|uniref:DUF4352 domain-containing protein n=1 Tax=Paenibacillus filicis TaxID=669464 RepID=A0ABU9DID3_9BACL